MGFKEWFASKLKATTSESQGRELMAWGDEYEEAFLAGHKSATDELNKEHLCSGCNDIVIENGQCDTCNWVKKEHRSHSGKCPM